MKPLVYLAGPITGDPFGCVRQATSEFTTLRTMGLVPVIHEMVNPQTYKDWMADVIAHCDALIRLPGLSPGADFEVGLAIDLGLPIFALAPSGDQRILDLEALREWAAEHQEAGPRP